MLDQKQFADKLIEVIKKKKISPRARWRFVLKNYLVWFMGVIFLLFAAASSSLIFYITKNENSLIYRHAGGGLIESLLVIVPVFWIFCLLIFIFLVYFNIKKTKKGYKYSLGFLLLTIVIVSLIISIIFSLLKVDKQIDDHLGRRAPYYESVINPAINFWSNPKEGRLSGVIIQKLSDDKYLLINKKREEWLVVYTANFPKKLFIDRPVRLLGQQVSEHEFLAYEVEEMIPGQGFFNKPGMKTPHKCLKDATSNNCQYFMNKPK